MQFDSIIKKFLLGLNYKYNVYLNHNYVGVLIMSSQLIEIFLFVDPLGKRCNNVRKIISSFKTERPERIKIRVIPMVNFSKVYRHTRRQSISLDSSIVDQNNQFSNNTYQACLAFHASAMQGKKMAHKFLEVLQEQVVEEGLPYTDELMYSIVKNIGLDVEMFTEDYKSELTEKIYKKNLNIAAEMKVKSTPSCVIFKDDDEEEAIRLNKEIEKEILHTLCGIDNSLKPKADDDEVSKESKLEKNVLKLK